jgi:diacylglycerol kinase family enzyme
VTIQKGRPWGEPGTLPANGVVVGTDLEARRIVEAARAEGQPIPTIGLVGGDLCKTLGGLGRIDRLRSPEAMTFPVDIGRITVDGRDRWFVAHAVARHRGWVGRAVAIMNAQWLGHWDLGPRAHPDDALLDVTDGALPIGDLLKARRRVRTGIHLPHPALHTSRRPDIDIELDRPLALWLDGERVGRTDHLLVAVEPDAIEVVI